MTGRRAPAKLGRRGARLWKALGLTVDLTGGRLEIALEACRCADRLDRLDALITGDERAWAELRDAEGKTRAVLVIDNALSHSRMNQSTLRGLLAALGVVNGEAGVAAPPAPPAASGGSSVDEIAAARQLRLEEDLRGAAATDQ